MTLLFIATNGHIDAMWTTCAAFSMRSSLEEKALGRMSKHVGLHVVGGTIGKCLPGVNRQMPTSLKNVVPDVSEAQIPQLSDYRAGLGGKLLCQRQEKGAVFLAADRPIGIDQLENARIVLRLVRALGVDLRLVAALAAGLLGS